MKKLKISSINLHNYRNFSQFSIDTDNQNVIFIGKNGSGKTNLLESISLLTPGRGLRNAALDDICYNDSGCWGSHFTADSKLGIATITNNFTKSPKKRAIEYNGSKINNAELANLLHIIWLVPQMDHIFLEGASDRRRFLDRIVYNFHSGHAKEVYRYEHYVSERLRILTKSLPNNIKAKNDWLDILEQKITMSAKNIFTNRQDAISMMQASINKMDSKFPKAILGMSVLDDVCCMDNFDEYYPATLKNNREKDSITGKTNFGVHRNDFLVTHQDKNRLAKFCSTGEQKAMLISIILAQIEAIKEHNKLLPIMLLDELFVHLDEVKSNQLIEYILSSNMQVFITGTDLGAMNQLRETAQIIEL